MFAHWVVRGQSGKQKTQLGAGQMCLLGRGGLYPPGWKSLGQSKGPKVRSWTSPWHIVFPLCFPP